MAKKDKPRRKGGVLINIGIVVCLGVLVFSGVMLYRNWAERRAAVEEYDTIAAEFEAAAPREQLAEDPQGFASDPNIRELMRQYAQNPDFVGLIYIPGTNIFYPMVQGSDDSYYLTHTYEGSYNPSGAIFMTHTAERDFSFPNTIIYGHNMHNGTMFENLNLLLDNGTLANYHKAYIFTPEEVRVYDLFWAGTTDITDPRYETYFASDEALQAYLDGIAPGLGLGTGDKVLTLSTCTYERDSDNRVVAQGVLEEIVEVDFS